MARYQSAWEKSMEEERSRNQNRGNSGSYSSYSSGGSSGSSGSSGTSARTGYVGAGGVTYDYVPNGAVAGSDGNLYYRQPDNYYDSTDLGADASLLSAHGQAEIAEYKRQFLAAQAIGDQAGMDRAHAAAEAIRARAGYSGGANGGAYNVLWRDPNEGLSGGGSGRGGGSSYSSRYQDEIDTLAQQLLSGLSGGGGMGGGSNGFSYRQAPAYVNRYQDQIDALSRQILGRAAFSYDPEQDATYRQYRDSYTRGGQRAMQDTLGQMAARTGGMASSYAESAAQQTYDGYMSALANRIPELQQLAYQMYVDEWNGRRGELSMLQEMEQSDFDHYLSELSQYNADRTLAYNAHQDQLSNLRQALESLAGLERADYSRYRDQVSGQQDATARAYDWAVQADQTAYDRAVYADETAYKRGLYDDETDYDRKLQRAKLLAQSGDFSGYQDLGYSEEEVQRMQAAFLLQHPELAALFQTAGSGGSYVGADSMGNTIYFKNGVGTYSDGTRYYDGYGW